MKISGVAITRRERDILDQLISHDGPSDKIIAHRLGLTYPSVKVMTSRLYKKLGTSNRLETALLAVRSQLPEWRA